MTFKKLIAATSVAAAMFAAAPSFAQPALSSTTMDVDVLLTVIGGCEFNDGSQGPAAVGTSVNKAWIDFGSVTAGSGPLSQSIGLGSQANAGGLTAYCAAGTGGGVLMATAANDAAAAGDNQSTMVGVGGGATATDTIDYNLFLGGVPFNLSPNGELGTDGNIPDTVNGGFVPFGDFANADNGSEFAIAEGAGGRALTISATTNVPDTAVAGDYKDVVTLHLWVNM